MRRKIKNKNDRSTFVSAILCVSFFHFSLSSSSDVRANMKLFCHEWHTHNNNKQKKRTTRQNWPSKHTQFIKQRKKKKNKHTKTQTKSRGTVNQITSIIGNLCHFSLLFHGCFLFQITMVCHIRYNFRILFHTQCFRIVCHLNRNENNEHCCASKLTFKFEINKKTKIRLARSSETEEKSRRTTTNRLNLFIRSIKII